MSASSGPAAAEEAPTRVPRSPATELGPRANRTIAGLIAAAREVFLTRGYAGTTIDEIARAAGVSRASFYTYFPTKRDVLIAVGARAASDAFAAVEQLRVAERTADGMTAWVAAWFTTLDEHGSFAFAWTQAAHDDGQIRVAGMARHLELCRHLGMAIIDITGAESADVTASGLVAASALERSWSYCQLYGSAAERSVVARELTRMFFPTMFA